MPHRGPALCLGLILFLPLLSATAAAQNVARIQADAVGVDFDRERTHAVGNARLAYGDFEICADELTADRVTGQVSASGSLQLRQGERQLRGRTLEYNMRTEEGVLTEARSAEQGIIISGERITFSPRELVAHNAYFTTCDRPDPHYSFNAERITLTAAETQHGGTPKSGRLSLNRARVTYHGRTLFTLPRYSVAVGSLGEPGGAPLPITGVSRDDGPYAAISYSLAPTDERTIADFSYRYTTFRGVRGHVRVGRHVGPAELSLQYVRREDGADRELRADDLETGLADVMINRSPEYGLRLPGLALGPRLRVRGEWLRGSYSEAFAGEQFARADADRSSASILVYAVPYALSPTITLSHAFGWRQSRYDPGDEFRVRFYSHTASITMGQRGRLAVSHVARRGSGETPFLFDGLGPERELLGDARWRLSPTWRFRLVELYDLKARDVRDMIFEVTRTVHCLNYTVGWRKSRGAFYVGIGLAQPSAE